jgi:hypothetical protein
MDRCCDRDHSRFAGYEWTMTIDIKATIRAAVDILTREADNLRECHTMARDPDDWNGEEDAKTAYDHELSIAGALADIPAIFDAQAAEIADAKGQIEFLDRQNTGLRAQHSRDSKTLREYAQARDDLRKERDRLRKAVQETVRILQSNNPAITDTVWVTGSISETLLDRCLNALAQEGS